VKRLAVFFDRDGTIMEEVGYCSQPSQVRVFPDARDAIQRLRDRGFLVIIITNQSGIGHGYFTEEQYRAVTAEMTRQLEPLAVDGIYFSADTPESESPRRKPNPGMVLEAAAEFDIDLSRSYFVGDRTGDIDCGRNAGTRTILVETGYGADASECAPDYRAPDLTAAIDWILLDARELPN
jgi:D-glycero-D-manno-heptose 1,7-bisphosphate phosphatase